MVLTLDIDRSYLSPNHPEGEYRMWLWRDDRNGGALVVLTQLPRDAGEGLMARLGPIASEVARDHRLDPDRTLWYVRQVTGPHRESIHAVEFRVAPGSAALFHPDASASSRGQVEILTQSPLPAISADEYRKGGTP